MSKPSPQRDLPARPETPLSSLVEIPKRVEEALARSARAHQLEVLVEQEGRVHTNQDGILQLSGLDDTGFEELVTVEGLPALVMGLTEHAMTAALLVDTKRASRVAIDARVRPSRQPLSISVSEHLLGRVIDPLGNPLDGLPLAAGGQPMHIERAAPQIFERAEVHTPLYTGTLAIDAMFPIGRGQRELIAGDEGTGKTSLAVDAMLRQGHGEVVAIYAGVGQRRAELWRINRLLAEAGVKFVMVVTPDDASPALRYLTPFAATAVGEHFRDRGQHALVVYDDLTAHAIAWRELSSLLGRPPGREAYPGDIFYLHSRLLERSAQLSDALGGGSLTALPICALEGGRLTSYIPTNLVSITDGQLMLSSALFASGQRPAIDAGLSVSRIGARAQSPLLASFTGQLKVDYAAFLELEAFSRLGTRLEPEAQRRIELGRRVRVLLRARQGAPLDELSEVVRLALARDEGLLLQLSESRVADVAHEVTAAIRARYPEALGEVRNGTLTREVIAQRVALVASELIRG